MFKTWVKAADATTKPDYSNRSLCGERHPHFTTPQTLFNRAGVL